ncbi:hypothetical protein BJY52DRAFT_1297356 [Lactarius psammicola]|nr:hypothetical protein BJY52DRAFT_1297356 [Lactarius psammicola]
MAYRHLATKCPLSLSCSDNPRPARDTYSHGGAPMRHLDTGATFLWVFSSWNVNTSGLFHRPTRTIHQNTPLHFYRYTTSMQCVRMHLRSQCPHASIRARIRYVPISSFPIPIIRSPPSSSTRATPPVLCASLHGPCSHHCTRQARLCRCTRLHVASQVRRLFAHCADPHDDANQHHAFR